MAGNNVSSVYLHVIEDVVSKVREEFVSSGAGEGVLEELQALWEAKMLQCGAVSGNTERPPASKQVAGGVITPVHDLNVPYEGTEEYETPTAEMLFPPTPLQTPIPTPLPGDQGMYNIPTGPSDYAPSPIADVRNGLDVKNVRASPYMQPPSPWMNQRLVGVDVNVAYEEGREEMDRGAFNLPATQDFFTTLSGKRKRDDNAPLILSDGQLPQQDGSVDVTIEILPPEASQYQDSSSQHSKSAARNKSLTGESRSGLPLGQQDGTQDEYELFPYQGVASEDYNSPAEHVDLRAPTPSVGTPKPSKGEAADDEEPPLNEDDDDDEDVDDLEYGEELPQTQHLVLAQFDKVTRTKSRWKCTLKDGIMHINGRDILFNKANGEFEF